MSNNWVIKGPNKSLELEEPIRFTYTSNRSLVFDFDPEVLAYKEFRDCDVVINVQELSGNNISVDIVSVVSGIEYVERTLNVTGGSSVQYKTLSNTKYRIYAYATVAGVQGDMLLGVRITYYR